MSGATLSRQLFIRIVPTILVTIVLIGSFAFHSAKKQINTVYDAQMINDVNVLLSLMTDELSQAKANGPQQIRDVDLPNISSNESTDEYADARMFRIWKEGRVILYSESALPADLPQQQIGFHTLSYNRDDWRVYTLPVPQSGVMIEMGEKMNLRRTLVANILWNLSAPLLLLIPLVAGLLWVGIGSGLGSIRTLVQQIGSRSANDLSQIDLENVPKDIAPLGQSINQLLLQLERSLSAERQFADHAAHQLRTPLAVLKLQLQMLSEAKSEAERQDLINALLQSNARASKMVGQLLATIRLPHQTICWSMVSLDGILPDIIAEYAPMALQKNIELSLEVPLDAKVQSDDATLRLMIGNIVENAVKYTPKGGTILVCARRKGAEWEIRIDDTGPGIPLSERSRVFQRFYRVNAKLSDGAGLGLAIVSEVAERLAVKINLEDSILGLVGLGVVIYLPAA